MPQGIKCLHCRWFYIKFIEFYPLYTTFLMTYALDSWGRLTSSTAGGRLSVSPAPVHTAQCWHILLMVRMNLSIISRFVSHTNLYGVKEKHNHMHLISGWVLHLLSNKSPKYSRTSKMVWNVEHGFKNDHFSCFHKCSNKHEQPYWEMWKDSILHQIQYWV